MVSIPEAKLVKVSELEEDELNPNQMTDQQLNALKKNIQKYGFLMPIITNKALKIADGHQRVTAAIALEMEEVPVIQLPIEEVDRVIIQRVMNKLRGVHDLALDIQKYEFLNDEKQLSLLADLTAQDLEKFNDLINIEKEFLEKELDENIKTLNKCPKCDYKW